MSLVTSAACSDLRLLPAKDETYVVLRRSCAVGPLTLERLRMALPRGEAAAAVSDLARLRCLFVDAELTLDQARLDGWLAARRSVAAGLGLTGLTARLVDGGLRLGATFERTGAAAVAHLVPLSGPGRMLGLRIDELRPFGLPPEPAPMCAAHLLAALLPEAASLPPASTPLVARAGLELVQVDPLRTALLAALPSAGLRLPSLLTARLASIEIGDGLVTIRFGSGAQVAPPPVEGDPSPGEQAIVEGRREAAIAWWRRGHMGGDRWASLRLLELLLVDPTTWGEAEELAKGLLLTDAKPSPVAQLALAALEGARGDRAAAAARYHACADEAEAAGEAEELIAALDRAAALFDEVAWGRGAEARRRLCALRPPPPLGERWEALHLAHGRRALAAGDLRVADQHLTLAGHGVEVLTMRQRVHRERRDYRGLITTSQALVDLLAASEEQRPARLQARLDLGAAYLEVDEAAAALATFREAATQFPTEPAVLDRLGETALRCHRLTEARGAWDRLLEQGGAGVPGLALRLGELATQQGDHRGAAAYYQTALERGAEGEAAAQARRALETLEQAATNPEAAVRALLATVDDRGTAPPAVAAARLLQAARLLHRTLRRDQEARRLCERAVALDPTCLAAYDLLEVLLAGDRRALAELMRRRAALVDRASPRPGPGGPDDGLDRTISSGEASGEATLRGETDDPSDLLTAAAEARSRGEVAKERALLLGFIALPAEPGSRDERLSAYRRLAQIFSEAEEGAATESAARHALALAPDDREALELLDRLYTRGDRLDELAAILERRAALLDGAEQQLLRVRAQAVERRRRRQRGPQAQGPARPKEGGLPEGAVGETEPGLTAAGWAEETGPAAYSQGGPGERASHWRSLAEEAETEGHLEEAIELYRLAAGADPTQPGLLEAMARLAARQGDPEGQYESLLPLVDLLPTDSSPRRAELLLRLAELALARGSMAAARGHLEAAVAEQPRHSLALRRLADVCASTAEWRRGVEVLGQLAQAVEDPRERAELIYRQSEIYRLHLRSPERAWDGYLRAADIAPDHLPTMERLVLYYLRRSDLAQARQVLQEIERLGALRDEATVEAGLFHAASGDPATAASLFRGAEVDRLCTALCLLEPARIDSLDGALWAIAEGLPEADRWPDPIARHLGARLGRDPGDLAARMLLARWCEFRAVPGVARTHYEVIAWIDPARGADDRLSQPAPTSAPEEPLDEPTPPPLRMALRQLAPLALGLAAPRQGAVVEPALTARLDPLAARFGLRGLTVATVEALDEPALIEATSRPRLLLRRALAAAANETTFAAARALHLFLSGLAFVDGRSAEEVATDLRIALAALEPRVRSQPEEPRPGPVRLRALASRLHALPDDRRGAIRGALQVLAQPVHLAHLHEHVSLERRLANRQALRRTGDLGAALQALTGLPPRALPSARLIALRSDGALADLIHFAGSPAEPA